MAPRHLKDEQDSLPGFAVSDTKTDEFWLIGVEAVDQQEATAGRVAGFLPKEMADAEQFYEEFAAGRYWNGPPLRQVSLFGIPVGGDLRDRRPIRSVRFASA